MPELPEIEVLVRHLAPLVRHRTVRRVEVRRAKVLRPTPPARFRRALRNAEFIDLARRGKYLVFQLRAPTQTVPLILLGHLGMSGRMFCQPGDAAWPRHTAVVLDLRETNLVYEDARGFGRLTLDTSPLQRLGPEPLEATFSAESLSAALARSAQPVKVKLLDQSVLAGVGNIYASEALFASGIAPWIPARSLTRCQTNRLRENLRSVLAEAIEWGSTVPLDWAGAGARDGLFYYGLAEGARDYYTERLRVYDREGRPCLKCGSAIKRLVLGGRGTFYCPRCQRA